MIFQKLADGIISHAKLIIVIWIVILLLSVYPAIRAGDQLSYDQNSMGAGHSESQEGAEIIDTYFQSFGDNESLQLILVTYTDAEDPYVDTLSDNVKNIANVNDKVASVLVGGQYSNEDGKLMLYAVSYKEEDASGNKIDIADDTGNLRNQANDAVAASIPSEKMGDVRTYVTGSPQISYDAGRSMNKDLSIIDPFAVMMILILVGLFFRSPVSSAAPPITIGVAFALVMCALFFLGQMFSIYYLTEVLLLVSMLGAGCDYCIFILQRYREERRSGKEHIPACREAITWAGESVATSGIAVIIGFGAMMLCSFGLIKYMGMGLAIGIVFALLAALTLMSSILVLAGDKLFWPTGTAGVKLERGYMRKMSAVAVSYFRRSSKFSIKHAKVVIIASLLFTVPMTYIYVTSENSYDIVGSMMTGDSKDGMDVMVEYAGGGVIMPDYAVIEMTDPVATVFYNPLYGGDIGFLKWSGNEQRTLQQLGEIATTADQMPNVTAAYLSYFDNLGAEAIPDTCPHWIDIATFLQEYQGWPDDYDIIDALNFFRDPDCPLKLPASVTGLIDIAIESVFKQLEKYWKITYKSDIACWVMDWLMYVQTGALAENSATAQHTEVIYAKITMETKEQAMSDESIKTLGDFKSYVHSYVDESPALKQAYICGSAAVMLEISEDVGGEFLKIELIAIILIILLLFFVLKSYLTPIRSVATIFMSVIWTVAITQLLFHDLLHQGVIWFLPIILVVICLGLGMDYDILLTTRIREYHVNKGMSNDDAIINAVEHSGSVITICGIIMAGTFGTMMVSGTLMMRELGFALCFAILVDALLVRTYIVPACMHLMGEWNWKGPAFLKRNEISHRKSRMSWDEEQNQGPR